MPRRTRRSEPEAEEPKPKSDHIETTLGACAAAWQALGRLAALKLPILVAYHLKTLCRLVEPEVKHFEEERAKFIKELGKKRKATDAERALGWDDEVTIVENGPKKADFLRRMKELAEVKVTIRAFPVPLSVLGDGAEITAEDLLVLDPFVEGVPGGGSGATK